MITDNWSSLVNLGVVSPKVIVFPKQSHPDHFSSIGFGEHFLKSKWIIKSYTFSNVCSYVGNITDAVQGKTDILSKFFFRNIKGWWEGSFNKRGNLEGNMIAEVKTEKKLQ